MLSYLSVLSAYLKKQLACQKRAGGYDLIFKNTETRETGRDFFCCFRNGCLYLCLFFSFFFWLMFILFIVYHWFGLGGRSLNQNRRVS